MVLLDLHPGRRLSQALLSLLEIHPAALLGEARARREGRRVDAALAALPPHLLEDIGLRRLGPPEADDELSGIVSMTAALRS